MLTFGSLFAGIGGWDLGLERVGFRCAWQIEKDGYCQKVLAKHWPDVARYGDIRECGVDRPYQLASVDVLAGGFPCFVAGTLVLTREGYRPIETLVPGDVVLTHLGNWKPITSIMKRENAVLRCVKAQGVPGIVTTDEHPFFARHQKLLWNNDKRAYERHFSNPKWIEAQHLNSSYHVAQVLPEAQVSEKSNDFWWLVGRYLADGWRQHRASRGNGIRTTKKTSGRVVICCAHHEADLLRKKIADAGYRASEVVETTATKFHITKTDFYHFLEPFGQYAHGKTLPGFALELDDNSAKALLDGYVSGDGYREANRREWIATTTSKSLALGIALLAQRAYGVVATIRHTPMKNKTIIEGRTVNQRDFYRVTIPDNNRSAFVEEKYGWKLVRSTTSCGSGTVYNISVKDDESYMADGVVVHNCQPHSLAGDRQASQDERELWPEFARLIREIRPRWVLAENVLGLLSSENGQFFGRVLRDLAEVRYDAQWFVLPASQFGAPHRRERVFILAHASSCRLEKQQDTSRTDNQSDPSGFCTMAYPNSHRLWIREDQQEFGQECQRTPDAGAHGKERVVAYASSPGWQKCIASLVASDEGHSTRGVVEGARKGVSEPGVGRGPHGVPARMDRHRWPALPGERQHDWEPPRVTPVAAPNKSQRLKALGNAVVPQVAEYVGRLIMQHEEA